MEYKKTKVLVYGMTANYGGVESFIMNYYRNIDRDLFQFDFLCDSIKSIAFDKELEEYGSKIYYITPRRKNYFEYKRDLRLFFKTHSSDYDVIWVNLCDLVNIDFLKLACKYKIPKRIIHSHNTDSLERYIKTVIHRFNRHFLEKYATDFWACSKEASNWFFNDKIVDRCEIIHNAIEIEQYYYIESKRELIRKEHNLGDSFVIGTVGRLCSQKNHGFLIDLCKDIVGIDYKVVIVGEGEDREDLKKSIKENGLEERVLLVGMQRDIQGWLSAFDVFVLPSKYEGLGIVALEAQASGLPVVESTVVPAEGIVNENVYQLPLNEKSKWIELLKRISNKTCRINSEESYRNLSNNGFDIKLEKKRLEDLL